MPDTITRTWTVTDDCGNQAICEQIINVEPVELGCYNLILNTEYDGANTTYTWKLTTIQDCPALSYILFQIPWNKTLVNPTNGETVAIF